MSQVFATKEQVKTVCDLVEESIQPFAKGYPAFARGYRQAMEDLKAVLDGDTSCIRFSASWRPGKR